MTSPDEPRLIGQLKTVSTTTAMGVIVISSLVLVGWIFGNPFLKNFKIGMVSMEFFTTLSLLLAGMSLWLSQESRTQVRGKRVVAQILAFAVATMGLLGLLDYLFGWNQKYFQWLEWPPGGTSLPPASSHIAPNSALTLLLIGLSLLLLDVRTRRGRHPAHYLTGVGGVVTSVALMGYIYGAPQFYAPAASAHAMSFPAVLAGLFAFLGIWLARPGPLWEALLTDDKAGSIMARNFILPVLLVPISIDIILLVGQNAGFYDYHLESAAHVVLTVLVFILFVVIAARSLNTAEARRFHAEAENARLAAIVETSDDAIISKNLDGTIRSWNPSAERMFGYRAGEIIGKSISLILPPEKVHEEEEIVQKLASGQRVDHFETQRIARDGRRIDVSITTSPLMDRPGHVVGASKIIRDISQRKYAETRMRLLAAALQATANAIAISGRDGKIQWINAAFTRLTGYSDQEAVGLNPNVLKSGRHDSVFYQEMWETILAGQPWHGELMNKRKDGSVYIEEMTITPVIGKDGEVTHFIAVKQDITERKGMEEELRRSEQQFHAMANGIPQLAWMAEPDGNITWYNKRWHDYTGTTLEQMQGWGWQIVHDPELLPQVLERWKKSLATGEPFEMEFPLRGADGIYRPFLTRGIPLKNSEGRVTQWFGTNTDITARKRIEEKLRKASKQLGAANVSLRQSRQAAMNLMDDALNARQRAEKLNNELRREVEERKEAEEKLRRLNRILKARSNSDQAMMRVQEEESYLKEVCQNVVRDCGEAMAWIGYAENDQEKSVRPVAWAGFEDGYLDTLKITWADTDRGRGPTGTAIRTGEFCQCLNVLTDPKLAPWREDAIKRGYASSIALPLHGDGKVFGVLTIYSRHPDPFTQDDVELLRQLANDLSFGVVALRLRKSHREVEQALRDSEAHYRNLFNTMSEGFALHELICDAEGRPCNYRFLEVNPAYERLTGLHATEVIGRTVLDVMPGTEPMWIERFGRVALTGEPDHFDAESRVLGRWYEVYVSRTEMGRFAVVFLNVTERKKAEEALRRSNARINLLAKVASDLLRSDAPQTIVHSLCRKVLVFLDCQVFLNFLVDEKKGKLHLNAHAGVSEEEARKIEWLDYGVAVCGCAARDACRIVVEDIPTSQDPRADLVKGFGILTYACHPLMVGKRLLGTLSFGTRTRAHFEEDELSLMMAVADQVAISIESQRTEEALRLAADDLERSNRDLEQFAYVASHDLQEPLRAVSGYTQLLQQRYPNQLDEKGRQYIAGAAEGAIRMQRLIHDLLAFSRVSSQGKSFEPTDLNVLLARALENLSVSLKEASPKLTTGPLPTVRVDPTQITQLFQNLIGNAIKFKNSRPLEIEISARRETVRWVLWVRDNGIGIEPQYYERIFQIFQRLHTRTAYPGTGIGLAVCKRIVERHGGTIWVESQPGSGTTFYFTINDNPSL